MECTQRFSLE
jgi:hypothetical protein